MPINKKMRQWFLGVTLILVCLIVWWKLVYSPWQEKRDYLAGQVDMKTQERDRLAQRLEKLSDSKKGHGTVLETHTRFTELVVRGNSPDEVSAQTQLWVQEFLESRALSLKAYKSLPPGNWREYPLGRVQFQLGATTQGLSELLEMLEHMEKAVRIEKLGVNYRRSKDYDLRVSLQLGTLFVEGLME